MAKGMCSMRQTLSLLVLMFAVLGCLTIADGILDAQAAPSDFDGSSNPRPEPVASLQHPSLSFHRRLNYDLPLIRRARPPSPDQGSGSRVLLAKRAMGASSRRLPGRILRPRQNTSASQASVSPCDPARTI